MDSSSCRSGRIQNPSDNDGRLHCGDSSNAVGGVVSCIAIPPADETVTPSPTTSVTHSSPITTPYWCAGAPDCLWRCSWLHPVTKLYRPGRDRAYHFYTCPGMCRGARCFRRPVRSCIPAPSWLSSTAEAITIATLTGTAPGADGVLQTTVVTWTGSSVTTTTDLWCFSCRLLPLHGSARVLSVTQTVV